MYGFIWRAIPGPWPVKLIVSIGMLVGIFFLLMEVVFPYVSTLMPYNDVAV
ncbi:MAG: hypothetical protein Q4A92_01770 [Corynebacterium sp.]|nr:hypothetical protein [Corynebacterium sp.]